MGEWICDRNKMNVINVNPFLPGNLYSYSIKNFTFNITPTEMYKSIYTVPKRIMPYSTGNNSWQNSLSSYGDYFEDSGLISDVSKVTPVTKAWPVEKNGSIIRFTPFQIVPVEGKLGEFYLEGESDAPPDTAGIDTRLYSKHRPTLQHFLDHDVLDGEICAIAFAKGKRVFYVKNVKAHKPQAVEPEVGNILYLKQRTH
jgi:hypothetical protein